MEDIRSEPSQVDAPWLTDAVEEAGVARGAKVLDVAYVGDIGTDQTGRNSRFALTWDAEDRPASIVGKFPSADENARVSAFGNGTYLKEWLFYSQVKPTVGIRTPECHVARYDDAAQAFVPVGPVLDDTAWDDVLVVLARSGDGRSLDLQLEPRRGPAAQLALTFTNLEPGRSYRLECDGAASRTVEGGVVAVELPEPRRFRLVPEAPA